jgi:pSer/pThr/pTyr-binding forkhead associated (FHA) protein
MSYGELDPVGGGDPIPLLKPKLLIGRRRHCDITLNFPNVSSEHCSLEFKDGYWLLRDNNSRNGVKVDGIRCQQKYLMPGEMISIAKNDFILRYEPESSEAPPELEENIFEMSLMEKAGLVSRRSERDKPNTPPPPTVKPPRKVETEDDQALRWLSDDEEMD